VKINVDATCSDDEGRGSVGAITKDCLGNFIDAQNKDLPFIVDDVSI
jgi:hypothetical protein